MLFSPQNNLICWCSGLFILRLLQGYILKKSYRTFWSKDQSQTFLCLFWLHNFTIFFYCWVKVSYVFLLIQCRDLFYCDNNTIISSTKTFVYSLQIIVCLFEDSGWRKCHTDCVHYIQCRYKKVFVRILLEFHCQKFFCKEKKHCTYYDFCMYYDFNGIWKKKHVSFVLLNFKKQKKYFARIRISKVKFCVRIFIMIVLIFDRSFVLLFWARNPEHQQIKLLWPKEPQTKPFKKKYSV